MERLPNEILENISSFLDWKSLLCLSMTNRRWNGSIESSSSWRLLCHVFFPDIHPPCKRKHVHSNKSYRKLFLSKAKRVADLKQIQECNLSESGVTLTSSPPIQGPIDFASIYPSTSTLSRGLPGDVRLIGSLFKDTYGAIAVIKKESIFGNLAEQGVLFVNPLPGTVKLFEGVDTNFFPGFTILGWFNMSSGLATFREFPTMAFFGVCTNEHNFPFYAKAGTYLILYVSGNDISTENVFQVGRGLLIPGPIQRWIQLLSSNFATAFDIWHNSVLGIVGFYSYFKSHWKALENEKIWGLSWTCFPYDVWQNYYENLKYKSSLIWSPYPILCNFG